MAKAPAQEDVSLDASLGAQVKRTQRVLSRALQMHLAKDEIPIGMWYFLRVLWEEDGLSQKEISERAAATAAVATEQLQNMEARGLIRREKGLKDRRKVHFFLTPKGSGLKEQMLQYPKAIESVALKGFSAGEIGFLRLMLTNIRTNLEHYADALGEALDADDN